jgi:hypothetical protein
MPANFNLPPDDMGVPPDYFEKKSLETRLAFYVPGGGQHFLTLPDHVSILILGGPHGGQMTTAYWAVSHPEYEFRLFTIANGEKASSQVVLQFKEIPVPKALDINIASQKLTRNILTQIDICDDTEKVGYITKIAVQQLTDKLKPNDKS